MCWSCSLIRRCICDLLSWTINFSTKSSTVALRRKVICVSGQVVSEASFQLLFSGYPESHGLVIKKRSVFLIPHKSHCTWEQHSTASYVDISYAGNNNQDVEPSHGLHCGIAWRFLGCWQWIWELCSMYTFTCTFFSTSTSCTEMK